MQHCTFSFTVWALLTNIQKKECPIHSFTYLRVKENREEISVTERIYAANMDTVQCGKNFEEYVRNKQGLRQHHRQLGSQKRY